MDQPDSTPSDQTQSLEDQIELERLRLVYASAQVPIIALACAAMVLASMLYFSQGLSWALPWAGLHLVLSGGRLYLIREFKQRTRLPQNIKFWRLAYITSLAIMGSMWGWIAWHLDPSWSIGEQLVVLTFLIGICSAGGLSHAYHLSAYMALLIPILLPLFWRLSTIGGVSYVLLGIGVGVFIVFMSILSRRYSSTTTQFIELRLRNQDLVANLSQVNEDLQREVAEHSRALDALAGRGRVLERLARGDSLQQVLDTLILSMEQIMPGTRGMIMRLDPNSQLLVFGAGPNLSERFVQLVDGMDPKSDRGSCIESVMEGKTVVVENIENHPQGAEFIARAKHHGFHSSWSEPILNADGAALGALTLYFRGPPQCGAFDHEFIQTSARLAGIAIERKNSEATVEQSHRLLEDRVVARTRELSLMVREVESFNYSVSHDLRSPLRAIDGYSQILLEDFAEDLPPIARDYLGRCRQASQRMGHLIDGLLNISRMSRKDLDRRWVNFSAVCEEIAERLDASSPQRSVEWLIQADISVWADPTLIEVVADNLLGNAWKFTANTAIGRIEIGSADQDGSIHVWVEDNGAGFEMEYVDKLFKPFQRLHDESQYKGTGIGLATVERIVRRHQGRVWGESQPARATRFTFALPLIDVSPQLPLLEDGG